MNGNDFLDKMSLISPELVQGADLKTKPRKSKIWLKAGSIAACIVLAAAVGFTANKKLNPVKVENSIAKDILSTDNQSIAVYDPETESETDNIIVTEKDSIAVQVTDGLSQDANVGNVCIRTFFVYDSRLYKLHSEQTTAWASAYELTEWQASEECLDKDLGIYPVPGKSAEEEIMSNRGGVTYFYKCIYNKKITFKGVDYALINDMKDEDKGQYSGEVDGLKIYDCLSDEDKIIIDVSAVINSKNTDSDGIYFSAVKAN